MRRLAPPWAWVSTLVPALIVLAGCAGAPKAPTCEGPYRSLDPAHDAPLKDRTSVDSPFQIPRS